MESNKTISSLFFWGMVVMYTIIFLGMATVMWGVVGMFAGLGGTPIPFQEFIGYLIPSFQFIGVAYLCILLILFLQRKLDRRYGYLFFLPMTFTLWVGFLFNILNLHVVAPTFAGIIIFAAPFYAINIIHTVFVGRRKNELSPVS